MLVNDKEFLRQILRILIGMTTPMSIADQERSKEAANNFIKECQRLLLAIVDKETIEIKTALLLN